jgi:hypothetical protein
MGELHSTFARFAFSRRQTFSVAGRMLLLSQSWRLYVPHHNTIVSGLQVKIAKKENTRFAKRKEIGGMRTNDLHTYKVGMIDLRYALKSAPISGCRNPTSTLACRMPNLFPIS